MIRIGGIAAAALLLGVTTAPTEAQARRDTVAAYRNRVLGVFDEGSGDPVEGVRVLDVLTGTWTETTKTGTVSLAFLPDGGGLVRLLKLGYETQTLFVAIAPSDVSPITVVMRRVVSLPAVVTKADSTRYVSPGLRGFEE